MNSAVTCQAISQAACCQNTSSTMDCRHQLMPCIGLGAIAAHSGQRKSAPKRKGCLTSTWVVLRVLGSMKCRVFMARVHSTRGPRCPMELEILDGRNTRSSFRERVEVRQGNTALARIHRMNCFNASAQKRREKTCVQRDGRTQMLPRCRSK